MLHMIGHIIFGLVIGILARIILPGRIHSGLIVTALLGMVGAWVGGLIGRALGWYSSGHPAGFFMALVGAILVLLIYGWVAGRSSHAATTFNLAPQSFVCWSGSASARGLDAANLHAT